MEMLEEVKQNLQLVTFDRAKHVIGECDRCLRTKEALLKKDYQVTDSYLSQVSLM